MTVERDAVYFRQSCYPRNSSGSWSVSKRKCREIGESPSMMWNRSIGQGCEEGRWRAGAGTALARALLLALVLACAGARGADLVIEIPGSGLGAGRYRLDYAPPSGAPAPNYTVAARAATINFTGLPGTQYHFMLYYSNESLHDLLTWNQTIVTAPDPPTDLAVAARNKQALVTWAPPAHGDYTAFRFRVLPLSERDAAPRNLTLDAPAADLLLRDLAPGATYQLHAFTLLHDKESAAYASRNFTTKPNTPGKFIVWFRNETTLLVLWQPPYPPGLYTHYKVSIVPADARDSELYVEKEGEPPGPAQAAFKGLVPGRAYNISVQTVSEPEISAPTTAQYRTVPLRPRDVHVPRDQLSETSFRVRWLPPLDVSEFDKYQVSVAGEGRRLAPVVRARTDPPHAAFDALEPGARYTVTVKTMSGKVTSWPATADVTLKPLPVVGLRAARTPAGALELSWAPAPDSVQDEYRVAYHEAESRDDASSLSVATPHAVLDALLPGRNYTVAVAAVSRGVPSNESLVSAATRPLQPVVLAAAAGERDLRLSWRSDVNSRQERYRVRYARASEPEPRAWQELTTTETSATLGSLFPGAVYEVRVAALAHGLASEEHAVLRAVRPLAPRALAVRRASSTGALVEWTGPARAASAVGQYTVRYRTVSAGAAEWLALAPLGPEATHAELHDLTPGERYQVELEAGSERAPAGESVPSGAPRRAELAVRPAPASNVAQLVDTRNVTLEWPRAAGRVERWALRWAPREPPGPPLERTVPDPGAGAGSVRAVLPDLEPGRAYSISITATSYNLTSDEFSMDTRTRPLIQSEMTIVTSPEGEGGEAGEGGEEEAPGILVTYTATPPSATLFDAYRFRLEGGEAGGGARGAERPAGEGARRVPFAALVPGALYNVTMWTVSHNVTSHPVQRAVRLAPRAVRWLNATHVAARHVELAWGAPAGVYSHFEVQYLAAADTLRTHTAPHAPLAVRDLRPHTLYTFTVVVVSGAPAALRTVSRAVSVAVATAQAPPPAPRRFRPADAAPGELAFEWELPADEANGRLTRFVLEYWPRDEPARVRSLEWAAEARAGVVRHLQPGREYEFSLAGETGAGRGEAARWAQRTPIGAPPRPAPDALPAPARASPTTATVRFRSDYFSPANGNLTGYTLVVGEEAREAPGALPSWRDVRRLPRWPPYQVAEPWLPFRAGGPAEEEFTIGAERCEEGSPAYCNGPLKPSTRYYVKLRAFTAPDKFTDTDYAEIHTEADNTAWVAGGAACVVACGAVVGGALAWRRRRRGAAVAPPAPAPRTSRPVRVADFVDHYRLMSADSDFRFSEEFEELKQVGRDQPCTAADLPVNRPKNRFTNILPYDHSRYKLRPVDDEEGSDYINANYVPGHASPREFIVTQGPLHATRDDFWRMVWESGSRAIVMLTRCVEKGREKCDRYWPYDTRPALYGDIAVTALNESRYPDWTVTELGVARGADQRRLLHFHFTTWPDFGVPEPPTALARFVRAFRERVPPDARPVVVHCSAGVGRSGTFITLDTALQQLARGADTLDVFGMVHAMRRERVWMVQTEQQYICIHQCLVAVLEGLDLLAGPPHHNHHLNPAFEDDEGIAESGM